VGSLLSQHPRAVNDETHPLASLIEVVGLLIEKYEDGQEHWERRGQSQVSTLILCANRGQGTNLDRTNADFRLEKWRVVQSLDSHKRNNSLISHSSPLALRSMRSAWRPER
jgi:hypothetical protein